MQAYDNSGEALLAEGDEHPSADDGLHAVRDGVGVGSVQRHRQANVAEIRHRLGAIVTSTGAGQP